MVVMLASCPVVDEASALLHNVVFGRGAASSFVDLLQDRAVYIDKCQTEDSNFHKTLKKVYGSLDSRHPSKLREALGHLSEKEKRVLEGCVVLIEFSKELLSILAFKELSNQMYTAGH